MLCKVSLTTALLWLENNEIAFLIFDFFYFEIRAYYVDFKCLLKVFGEELPCHLSESPVL